MLTQRAWQQSATTFLKSELQKRRITYRALALRLTARGVPETEGSVTKKILRGSFTAWFLMASIDAISGRKIGVVYGGEEATRHRSQQESVQEPSRQKAEGF
jgi:hypothetical protein